MTNVSCSGPAPGDRRADEAAMSAPSPRLRDAGRVLVFAAVYAGVARASLLTDAVAGFASLVWPPTGIALAVLVVGGRRLWPGVALGAFAANAWAGASVPVALGIATGNTLEALLGSTVLARFGFRPALDRLRDVLLLIGPAAVGSTAVSATIGTASLYAGGIVDAPRLAETWRAWWVGDGIGDLVVAPLLLAWSADRRLSSRPRRLAEAAGVAAFIAVACFLLFDDDRPDRLQVFRMPYLLLPALIWAPLRFDQRGVTAATGLAAVLAIWGTLTSHGPFVMETLHASLLRLQGFLAVASGTMLVMGAVILERRRAVESLGRTHGLLHAIFESSTDSMFVKDLEGRYRILNPAGLAVMGRTAEEAIGRDDLEIFGPEDGRLLRERDRAIAAGGVADTFEEHVTSGGRTTSFLVTKAPYRDENGAVAGVVGIARDVTEKKAAEEAARRSAAVSEALARSSRAFAEASLDVEKALETVAREIVDILGDACGINLLSDDGAFIRFAAHDHRDPEARALLSRILDEPRPADVGLMGQVVRSGRPLLVPEVDPVAFTAALEPRFREYGERFPVRSLLVVPLRVSGRVIGTIAVSRHRPGVPYTLADELLLTELSDRAALAIENARLYRKAQEAVRARDEFLSVASHELRTPLSALVLHLDGVTRLARQGATDPERLRAKVAMAVRVTERLSRLVESLLDVSRIGTGRIPLEIEPCDLAEVARDVVERVEDEAARAGVEVRMRGAGPVPGTWDRLRLEQVLTNLLSNAIRYGEGRPVEVSTEAAGDRALLHVLDHGIGISGGDMDRIFARFERAVPVRRYGGLGLGLYITRQIVEAHGGTIRVSSDPGSGTVFTVELPHQPPEAARDPAAIPEAPPSPPAAEIGPPAELRGAS